MSTTLVNVFFQPILRPWSALSAIGLINWREGRVRVAKKNFWQQPIVGGKGRLRIEAYFNPSPTFRYIKYVSFPDFNFKNGLIFLLASWQPSKKKGTNGDS